MIMTASQPLINADKLETKAELREAIHLSNQRLLKAAEQLHALAITHDRYTNWVSSIVSYHAAGQHGRVQQMLADVVAHKNKVAH